MAEEVKIKSKNNGNGKGTNDEDMQAALATYMAAKEKKDVPHAHHVLYGRNDEDGLDETSDLNDREIVFMAVNKLRDDALDPFRKLTISTLLRMHLKRLKISRNRKGRDEVVTINQLSQEEAMAQNGNRLE